MLIVIALVLGVAAVAMVVHRRRGGHTRRNSLLPQKPGLKGCVTIVKNNDGTTVIHGLDGDSPSDNVPMEWDDLVSRRNSGLNTALAETKHAIESTESALCHFTGGPSHYKYLASRDTTITNGRAEGWQTQAPSSPIQPAIEERETPEPPATPATPESQALEFAASPTVQHRPQPQSPGVRAMTSLDETSPPHATIDPHRTMALRAALTAHRLNRNTLIPSRVDLAEVAPTGTNRADPLRESTNADTPTHLRRAASIALPDSPREHVVPVEVPSTRSTLQKPPPGGLKRRVSCRQLDLPTIQIDFDDDDNLDGDSKSPAAVAKTSPKSPRKPRASWWNLKLLSDVSEEKSSICTASCDVGKLEEIAALEAVLADLQTVVASESRLDVPLTVTDVTPTAMDRETAAHLLLSSGHHHNGCFLLRTGHPYGETGELTIFLTYMYSGEVHHVPATRRSEQVYVGVRPFNSVFEAVQFFRANAPPADILKCKLTVACKWRESELQHAVTLAQGAPDRTADRACTSLLDDIDRSLTLPHNLGDIEI